MKVSEKTMSNVNSWRVTLEVIDGTALIASICGYPIKGGEKFAFYLMKGKERVAAKWYTGDPTTQFQMPEVSGEYHAIGFVRRDSLSAPEFRLSDVVPYMDETIYDLSQWKCPVFECVAVDGFSTALQLLDGIYHFSAERSFIDFRLNGAEYLKTGGVVLVCFGGAVTDRSKKVAPFFSGIRVSSSLRTPVLSVADSSLSLFKNLNLGWYAGNYLIPDLQKIIARLLDSFVKAYGVKLVMFGGSGGGFASLAVQSLMTSSATVVAWNPQTSISNYWASAVKKYLDVSFPLAKGMSVDHFYTKLDQRAILHDLTKNRPSCIHPVLYLQNQSDTHHVERHAKPFARSSGVRQISDTVLADTGDLAMWFGCWGQGHAVPPGDMIDFILRKISIGVPVVDLALELERINPDCAKVDLF